MPKTVTYAFEWIPNTDGSQPTTGRFIAVDGPLPGVVLTVTAEQAYALAAQIVGSPATEI